MFGIDIETGGLALDAELRLVQISNGEDTFVIDVRESNPRPLLQEFTGGELIAHNANFEEARLKRHLGIEYSEPMHDTMVMSQVLYAGTAQAQSLSHALDAVAMRELEIELDKEFQKADWGGEITPEMYEYAKKDAEILVPPAKHLLARIHIAFYRRTVYVNPIWVVRLTWVAFAVLQPRSSVWPFGGYPPVLPCNPTTQRLCLLAEGVELGQHGLLLGQRVADRELLRTVQAAHTAVRTAIAMSTQKPASRAPPSSSPPTTARS